MCGRARCSVRADDIPRACHISNGFTSTLQMDRYRPRYNVSPGSYMPVVRKENNGCDGQGQGQGQGQGGVVLHCMKWGLVPSFTKKTDKPDHYKMFNARSESICEKASFRRLVPKNRCLVTVEGFYEWKKDGSKKQPYYIHLKNGQPLVFAALYDSWVNSEGETLYTFTILTTSCSSALQWLHDRMPVILGNKSLIDAWLNGTSSSNFKTVLKPYEESELAWYPVTPAMGKPSFDGLECIIEIPLKAEENKLISKFFSKKKVDSEQESTSQIVSSSKESVDEDPEVLEEKTSSTDFEEPNEISVAGISHINHNEAERCGTKRNSISELKPYANNTETEKLRTSSQVKKKSKLKSTEDKQQTLLSFFGRSS